jgi:preprotein translocase subunit SecF
MWRASSSVRRPTASRAGSTASRRRSIALYLMPGANALDAADGAKKLMEKIKQSFPPDLDYVIALDTTLSVTEGIKEIQHTLFEALVLVMIVVFIFLQGWRATLIPLLAVPVSLVGTFMLFPLFGFSINTLSLFGLVLAIGLVVDDAIVVVEAVEHHIEHGMSPKDATLRAMEEVTGPVIAIAVILAAVFVPTAFIPGITGQLYQQFAVTIAISVIISAFNALTLSPALCAMLLRPKVKGSGPLQKFYDGFNRGLRPRYRRLRRHLPDRHPPQPDQPRLPGRRRRGSRLLRQDRSRRLPSRRGPGLRLCRRSSSPMPRRCNARRKSPPGRRTDHEGAGRQVHHHRRRLQHAEPGDEYLQRLLLHHPRELGGAQEARGAVRPRSRPN